MIPYFEMTISRRSAILVTECRQIPHLYFKPNPGSADFKIALSESMRDLVVADDSPFRFSPALRQAASGAEARYLNSERVEAIKAQFVYSLESYLHDPPPLDVMEELILFLMDKPQLVVEYLGRGRGVAPISASDSFDGREPATFGLDVPGGDRSYQWRMSAKGSKTANLPPQRFDHLREWLVDDDADVVLCLGGGGLRMLCLSSFFKILDYLNLRQHITEIWGCSMGAIFGYAYAIGLEPHRMEKIAYNFYNERHNRSMFGQAPGKLFWDMIKRQIFHANSEVSGLAEIQSTLIDILDDAAAQKTSHLRSLPVMAVATNVTRKRVLGLALNGDPPPECADFIRACEPLVGLSASAAVPLLFHAQRIPSSDGSGNELWFDGALGEEVPISMAYQSWRRRARLGSKRRLKIIFVESGSELSEIALFAKMERMLRSISKVAMPWRLADVMYETRFANLIRLVGEDERVEVKGIRLNLPAMSSMDPLMIPHIIRHGRGTIIKGMEAIDTELALAKRQTAQSTSA